jgi:hypothetical protein
MVFSPPVNGVRDLDWEWVHLLSANASLLLLSSACLLLLIGVLAGVVVEGQA